MINEKIYILAGKALIALLLLFTQAKAQIPQPALVGYWQNWNSQNAPYIPLDKIHPAYNVVNIAFAMPKAGSSCNIDFSPDRGTADNFAAQISKIQSSGKIVNISIGGGTSLIRLNTPSERDTFVLSITRIIDKYGFDGIDLDFEGQSMNVSGGTISDPIDPPVIYMINAIKSIQQIYKAKTGKHLILTMSPETASVQGGQKKVSGVWGAYLPLIDALRDSIDLLHVQLYNSGSMFGINGGIYSQASPDFIVAMTEALIKGFKTEAGFFDGMPESKIAVGLPSCSGAAGSGYTDSSFVRSAILYLLGKGPRPGEYKLANSKAYPQLAGMMAWSINWDALPACNGADSFAENFVKIFNSIELATKNAQAEPEPAITIELFANPASDYIILSRVEESNLPGHYVIYNSNGEEANSGTLYQTDSEVMVSQLAQGIYYLAFGNKNYKFLKY